MCKQIRPAVTEDISRIAEILIFTKEVRIALFSKMIMFLLVKCRCFRLQKLTWKILKS